MKIIGITGGVACGKSTVTEYLRQKKFQVVDADEIVQTLYKKKSIQNQIQNHFQTTDKSELREIIFSNPTARDVLEKLLHPLVQKEIQREIRSHKKNKTKILFFTIPLLFETNMEPLFDSIVAIVSDEEIQTKRLIKRDDITEEVAKNMIYAQIPNNRKSELADFTLTNNNSKSALLKKVDTLLKKI